jgi:outer membrane biosynthesis protein TonB
MKTWCAHALAGMALLSLSALAAQAQAPTKAQQDAIRSNCRSDFMRNCSSVTPGGREALECLMQNKAKASAGCQGALNAIAAPAPAAAKPEPKPEPKAAATPKSEPAPAATAPAAPAHHTTPAPATAQPSAPKAAAPKAATPKPAPAPKAAAAPARPAAPAVAPAVAPAAVTPAPPVTHQPKLGEAILIRRFCAMDFKVLCKGVQLGQGRVVQCLASNAAALSPGCRQAMIQTGELQP